MNFTTRSGWLCAALVFIVSSTRGQDGVEDHLRRSFPLPKRWDNIERAPEWVSGKQPRKEKRKNRHVISLQPGETTCARIPSFEWFRVQNENGEFSPGDIEIFLSNGSGLLASTKPVFEQQGQSLLVESGNPHPMLAHVSCPSNSTSGICVSLFTSRHEPQRDLAGYRKLIDLGRDCRVRQGTSDDADSLAFWKWNRGRKTTVTLRGPARFRLETRYRYPENESKLAQTYCVSVCDQRPAQIASLEYSTSHETANLVTIDGKASMVSRLESSFFELPENREYVVTLESSAPVLARLLQLEEPEYLFPSLNAPDPFSMTSSLCAEEVQGSLWEMSPSRLARTLADPTGESSGQVERSALFLARDNRRREGGMMAAALMWNAGASRRDYPEIRNRWREIMGFHTYYRDCFPEGGNHGKPFNAHFPTRFMQPVGKFRDSIVLGESHLDAGYRRFAKGIFIPIKSNGSRSVYHLPERSTSTRIRVAAHRGPSEPAEFQIQVSGEKCPRQFRLLPSRGISWMETRPTQGEAALHFLGGDTLRRPAVSNGEGLETVDAGFFEFTIPPGAQRIELWNESNAENLRVAIQYRASDTFALSEDEYLSWTENAGSRKEIFGWLADCVSKTTPGWDGHSRARKELCNHWEPLRRFVQSRYRQFEESVAGEIDDLAAGNLDLLLRENETFLAERLARTLYLHSGDPKTREHASRVLHQMAEAEIDDEKRVLNACVAFVRRPDQDHAGVLANLLRTSGESDLAMMLALVLPERSLETRDLRLATTFLGEWWAHFDAILREDPKDPVSQVWSGVLYEKNGSHDKAREAWKSAGQLGVPYLFHDEATGTAREKVCKGDPGGFLKWAEAEANHPGISLWKPVNAGIVESFPGRVSLRAIERDKFLGAWLATPEEPLKLSFNAPGQLKLECRPLHPPGPVSACEGWIAIEQNGRRIKSVPVLGNYPSPGLEVIGHPDERPGTRVVTYLTIDKWNDTLKIQPDFGPVLVRVMNRVPEIRCGLLSQLDIKTAARIFQGNRQTEKCHIEAGFGKVLFVKKDRVVDPHLLRAPFSRVSEESIRLVRSELSRLPGIEQSLSFESRQKAIDEINRKYWELQHGDGAQIQNAIASSARLERIPGVPELRRVHSAVMRNTYWDPLLSIEQSAGFRRIETPGWTPETPALKLRMRFLPKLGPREQLISGNDSAVALLTNKAENRITVTLSLDTISFLSPGSLKAAIRVGEEPQQEVTLTGDNPKRTFSFRVPKGQTTVRVEVLENDPNQYLRVEFDAENDREALNRKTTRNWFVATNDDPLLVRIAGPAWVRIDRLSGDTTDSEYRHVTGEVGELTLPPKAGENESLYRVHVLRFDPDKAYHPPKYTDRSITPVAGPIAGQVRAGRRNEIVLNDGFRAGGQEDGTLALGASYHSRRATEEDSTGGRNPEVFRQGDLTYRYYDEDKRTYFKTTLLGRSRDIGEPTVGITRSLRHNPFDCPFNYLFSGSIFEQNGDWAISGRSSLNYTQHLAPKWQHTPSISLFGRILTRDDSGNTPEEVDQDIFTTFKSDHGIGFRLAENIAYTPWRDTRLFAGVGLASNNDFNPFAPDSINYRAGGEQLLGPLRLGTEFRGYRYFADQDRGESVSRHFFQVEATGDIWTRSQDRLEIGGSWTHSIGENENSFFLFGRLQLSSGRMFRDFSPGEERFVDIRRRMIPRKRNNTIRD